MVTWLLLICTVPAVFLAVRLLFPGLLIVIRTALVSVEMNKAILDYTSGLTVDGRMAEIIIKDLRWAKQETDRSSVLARICKLRELYRILNVTRKQESKTTAPSNVICIVELADTLKRLARQTPPRPEFGYSCVEAQNLLLVIANNIRANKGEAPFTKEKEVEDWFTQSPISLEQVVEILIAAVFGLAYRLDHEGTDHRPQRPLRDREPHLFPKCFGQWDLDVEPFRVPAAPR